MSIDINLNVNGGAPIPLSIGGGEIPVRFGDTVTIPASYNDLNDKPQIEGVTLEGNKSAAALGLALEGLGISGASAGDILKVLSVDGNGKPTGFAAEKGVEIADVSTGGESSVGYTFATPRDWFVMCAINIGSGSPSSAAQNAYFGAIQVKQDGAATNWAQSVSGAVDYLNKSHLVALLTLGEIGSAVADTTAVSSSSTNLKINPFDNSKKGKVTKVSYTLQTSGGSRTAFANGSHFVVIAGNF